MIDPRSPGRALHLVGHSLRDCHLGPRMSTGRCPRCFNLALYMTDGQGLVHIGAPALSYLRVQVGSQSGYTAYFLLSFGFGSP